MTRPPFVHHEECDVDDDCSCGATEAERDYWALYVRENLWGLGPDKPKVGLRAIIDRADPT